MGHTVVGIFTHSGDADLAAAHLREAYTLGDDELDVIGEAEFDHLTRPAMDPTDEWLLAAVTGIGLTEMGEGDSVYRRWGDRVWHGETIVVARSDDPDLALEIAGEMRRAGANRVDVLRR